MLSVVAGGLAGKSGYDVLVLTFDWVGAEPTYPMDDKVKVIGLGAGDVRKKSGSWDVIARIVLLRSTLKRESPDLVVPFMSSAFVPVSLALVFTGIPVLASEHSVFSGRSKSPLVLLSFIFAVFLVKKMTCVSEAVKTTYPWIIRRKMHPLPNPVTRPLCCSKGKNAGRRMFLSVGRLEKPKDFATLVSSFHLIASELPEWDLYIYGEGSHRGLLEKMVDELNLGDRVFLPGVVDRIGEVYQKADIFVSSSGYESFGLAAAEAMTFGIPCIGFRDCPGINEIVVHNQSGLLAEGVGDPEKLAVRMRALAGDASERASLGENARIFVQQFDASLVVDKWESLIRKMAQ